MDAIRIAVVGGGPAGMMAAIRAGGLGKDVTLVEKNPILGKKLLLSGKGRCNLTNACELDAFLQRFSGNGQFLRDAFKKLFNRELIAFFEKRGLPLKVERQLRVFPSTDRSDSILEVLKKELIDKGVKIRYKTGVKGIITRENTVSGLLFENGSSLACERVILATGGVSYPFTGSDGEGLKIARKLGHKVLDLRPGLVPLETKDKEIKQLEGLTLKNIRLKFSSGRKQIVSEVGELLFTGSGISGPLVLTLSGKVTDWLAEEKQLFAEIDLKPALSREQLDARLLRDFRKHSKKSLRNALKDLLPLRLVDFFIARLDIPADKKSSQVNSPERQRLVALLKSLRFDILKARPIEEAMVTRGGVSLKEIDPRTMESRLIEGLYFAGEVMDIDADTGGFNLQAAFSTGYLAGESAALD